MDSIKSLTIDLQLNDRLKYSDKVSRLYRDLLGRVTQVLAQHSDEVYMMVAGIPVTIKSAH